MTARIQFRRDTAATWAAASPQPVLAAGEVGFETDTYLFKIGDGTTSWNSLPYPQASIPYLTTAATDVNTVVATGRYRFTAAQVSSLTNIPGQTAQAFAVQQYGAIDQTGGGSTDRGAILLVLRFTSTLSGAGSGDVIYQEITTYGDDSTTPDIPSKKWFRLRDGTNWQPWVAASIWADVSGTGTYSDKGTDIWCRRVRSTQGISAEERGSISDGALQIRGVSGDVAIHMYMPNSGEFAIARGGSVKQTITGTTTTLDNSVVIPTGNSLTLQGTSGLTVGTGGMTCNGTLAMATNTIQNVGLATNVNWVPRVGQITGVGGGSVGTFNPMISIGSVEGTAGSAYSKADTSGLVTWTGSFGTASTQPSIQPNSGTWTGLWFIDNSTANQNVAQVPSVSSGSPATTGVNAVSTRHTWIMFKTS